MAQKLKKGNILITGSSGGIGSATVKRLADAGYRVFAGVRNPDQITAWAKPLTPDVIPVKIDVTDPSSVASAARFVAGETRGKGLAGLINNAGYILQGPLELLSVEEIKEQFDVNVFGQICVTQAFLDLLRQAKGRLIQIGAVTGKTAMPFIGALSASKQAMEAVTDALRVELRPWNIRVIMIEPAAMETAIFDKARISATESLKKIPHEKIVLYEQALARVERSLEHQSLNPPDVVAKAVLKALHTSRPRTRYAVGRGARLAVMIGRLPDQWRDRLLIQALGLNKLSAPEKKKHR